MITCKSKQKKSSFLYWLVMPVILVAFLIQAELGVEAAAISGSWKVVATPSVTPPWVTYPD